MPLRNYQEISVNKILRAFNEHKRVLFQLSTGGGKTFTFCYLAQRFSKVGKCHILVNRSELVEQTYKTLIKLGVNAETITAKKKTINPHATVYVGMIETVNNRIKKGKIDPSEIGFCIIDECHRGEFDKVLNLYKGYILGCTATPIRLKPVYFNVCKICNSKNKEECCGQPCDEWSRPFAMAEIYDTIVTGVSISDLIQRGNLIKDSNFIFTPEETDSLKTDKSGDYTDKSLTQVYSNSKQIEMLFDAYLHHAKGKKTMVFCNSVATSRNCVDFFTQKGINCLYFDSKSKENRTEIVDKFKEQRDSILFNVNVFTTGFDVTDVECIIVYRATKSLALWLQMVGRGARPTDKIFKDNFTVIDFGMNIKEHDKWSAERDWEHIFYNGYGGKPKKKREIDNFWTCNNCQAFNPISTPVCEYCDEPKKTIVKQKRAVSGKIEALDEYPAPTASSIVKWCELNGENKNFAFKVLSNKILDLFKFYEVSKNDYLARREKYENRVEEIIRPVYFGVLKSNLPNGANRTLKNVNKRILTKIEKYYESK